MDSSFNATQRQGWLVCQEQQEQYAFSLCRVLDAGTLASGGYGFGRFYAAFTTLDEEGEPYRSVAEEYVDWSGTEVLVPTGTLPHAMTGPTTASGGNPPRTP